MPLNLGAIEGKRPAEQVYSPGVRGVAIGPAAWVEARNQDGNGGPASEGFEPSGDRLEGPGVILARTDNRQGAHSPGHQIRLLQKQVVGTI
jgi:hypothetical protein